MQRWEQLLMIAEDVEALWLALQGGSGMENEYEVRVRNGLVWVSRLARKLNVLLVEEGVDPIEDYKQPEGD